MATTRALLKAVDIACQKIVVACSAALVAANRPAE